MAGVQTSGKSDRFLWETCPEMGTCSLQVTAFLFWYLVVLQEAAALGSGLVPWGCGELREESGMEGI